MDKLVKLLIIIRFITNAKNDNWTVEKLEENTFEFTKEFEEIDLNYFLKKNLGII